MLQPTPYELHDGLWLLSASAEVDEPIDIARQMQSPSALVISEPEERANSDLLDRSPARTAKQGIVGREPRSSSAEHRRDRPDVRARGPVRHYSRSGSTSGIRGHY